jgi:hypothetical protein
MLLTVIGMGCFAGQALATDPAPTVTKGYIEICKFSSANPVLGNVSGPFTFTITDAGGHSQTATVSVGNCSGDIQVQSGTATVVETPTPWSVVTAITGLPGQNAVGTPNLTAGSVPVNVPAATTTAGAVTVNYTDAFDPGSIEICKSAATGSGLTGTYGFTVTGADGFTTTSSVTISAAIPTSCSMPIVVPAGQVTVQEGPQPVFVSALTATGPGNTNELLSGSSMATGTAVVGVNPGDSSQQTVVNFTDNVSTLKLCKVGDGTPAGLSYPFSFMVAGPAGPNGPTGPVSLMAGTAAAPVCTVVGQYRAGTTVQIAEGPVPGTKVESIAVTGITSTPASTLAGTVGVTMGAGQTLVTYTNEPADPGPLKICKLAGTPAPVGTSFSFTVTSNGGVLPQNVTVPVGQCAQVGGATFLYPYHATVTITEAPSTGNAVKDITVNSGGTVIPSGTNIPGGVFQLLTSDEGALAEVTYTDIDPPAPAPAPVTVTPPPTGGGSPVTTTGGGGGGGGSTGTGSTGAGTTTPTPTPALTAIVPAAGTTPGVGLGTTSTATGTKTAVANAVKLAKLQKQLTTLKLELKRLTAKQHAAKTAAAKHALAKQILAVKKSEAKLSVEIKLLKK